MTTRIDLEVAEHEGLLDVDPEILEEEGIEIEYDSLWDNLRANVKAFLARRNANHQDRKKKMYKNAPKWAVGIICFYFGIVFTNWLYDRFMHDANICSHAYDWVVDARTIVVLVFAIVVGFIFAFAGMKLFEKK